MNRGAFLAFAMRTRDANRYARWAAIVASLLAVIVLIVFVRRSWQAHSAEKQAPSPVPAAVERTSQGFTYTKGEGVNKLFTIRASNATVYKEGNRSLLMDVWITVYGRKGDRNDNIHTRSCDYLESAERVTCAGEVQMDLESAEDARRAASSSPDNEPPGGAFVPRIVHVITRGVTFDRDSGDAVTDLPVEFKFPGGEGRAVGANYASANGTLNMRHDIHLNLAPPAPKGTTTNAAPLPVELDGSSLEFQREAYVILLRGPVLGRQRGLPGSTSGTTNAANNTAVDAAGSPSNSTGEERELRATLLTVNLDRELHATKIVATGDSEERPQVRSTGAKGTGSISADQFIANLAPAGWVEHLSAVGNILSDYKSATDASHVTASRMDAEMVPKLNQPSRVTATGAVRANTTRGSAARTIETSALALDFIPGPSSRAGGQRRSQLSHARSPSPATVTMDDPIPGQPNSQQRVTHVFGQQVEADLGDHNRMQRMQGHGGTQLDRDLPGHARETSTSQDFAADFDSQGQWASFDQTGNVRFRQADRSGHASRAHIDRATDIVTFSGPAEASDASSHTSADDISFNQRTDEIRAEGNVLSTYSGRAGSSPGENAGVSPGGGAGGMGPALSLGSGPAHITSENLVGNSAAGHAVYTGHARMWQGDSIMEANEIELNRPANQLDARGNVNAVFQSAPSNPAKGAPSAPSLRPASNAPPIAPSGVATGGAEAKPEVWNVRTSKLTYYDAESRAHLDDGFTAESKGGSITGQNCDIYFVPVAQRSPGASGGIDHAIARGHVVVLQDTRRGQAERADYTAAAGKFVLSGGKPTLFDGDGNSVHGRQLTFFQADDTILVESEEGVRTLTRHRVQK